MMRAICGLVAAFAVAIGGQAQATILFEPPGNGNIVGDVNLLGNGGNLTGGPEVYVQGYLNDSSMGVMRVSSLSGSNLSWDSGAGQATIQLTKDTETGVVFQGETSPPANNGSPQFAIYNSIYSFTSISFDLNWDIPNNVNKEITITVEYLKAVVGGYATPSGPVTSSYTVPLSGNSNSDRFLAYATGGDIITKVTVAEVTGHFLNSITQIRVKGASSNVPIIIEGNPDIVPEPTSLALAGFAAIGMAVGVVRRRRQQKSQAA